MGSAASSRRIYKEENVDKIEHSEDRELTVGTSTQFTAQIHSVDLQNDQTLESDSVVTERWSDSSRRIVKIKSRPHLNVMVKDNSFNDSSNSSPVAHGGPVVAQTGTKPLEFNPREARLSPKRGSLCIGNFAINEKGLQRAKSDDECPCSFLSNGRSDFVMIGKLGTGKFVSSLPCHKALSYSPFSTTLCCCGWSRSRRYIWQCVRGPPHAYIDTRGFEDDPHLRVG